MSSTNDDERQRLARMELAQKMADLLPRAIGMGLPSESALISLLINAMLTNTTIDLLMKLRTTKPSA